MDLFGLFKRNALDGSDADQPADEGKRGGSYKERIVHIGGEEQSLTIAAVYRAAELRSNAIAGLRMRYMVKDNSGNYFREDVLPQGRKINYVLGVRPNSRQNAFQFWKSVEMRRMFYGKAYIYPVWGEDGALEALIPCNGYWDKDQNRYHLEEPAFRINKFVDASDVVVLRGIVTRSHPDGMGIIAYAARALEVSATTENLALETAAKGGRQKLLIQYNNTGGSVLGGYDPEEVKKRTQRMNESIHMDDVICIDDGGDPKVINMSMADLQLLESRKFAVSDIARFFGVPRSLLMDDTNSNYKSAESASLDFLSRTLQPLISETECEFDCKLLTRGEWGMHRFRFDTSSLFALDVDTKARWNKNRLETGVVSVNELREEMNMPAVEGGSTHYVSANLLPIDRKEATDE